MTRDLMIMAAAMLSKDKIIDRLEDAIKEWRIFNDEEHLTIVEFFCNLIVFKEIVENNGGVEKTLEDAHKLEQREKLFNIVTN